MQKTPKESRKSTEEILYTQGGYMLCRIKGSDKIYQVTHPTPDESGMCQIIMENYTTLVRRSDIEFLDERKDWKFEKVRDLIENGRKDFYSLKTDIEIL